MATTLRNGSRGGEVATLQRALGIKADGIFGPATEAALRQYQQRRGLDADGICGPATWAALGVTAPSTAPAGRVVTEIIVHCEATPEGEEFPRSTLEATHRAAGFSPYTAAGGKTEHIGYHYVVHLDGSVEACRPEAVAGCHCSGHNARSIGVSYVGGCPARSVKDWARKAKDTRTPAQKAALVKLLRELRRRYPGAKIYGHRDFSTKPCPSFDARAEYAAL